MNYPHWQPIGRLHIPEPMTELQSFAMRNLFYAAMDRGGILEFRSGIKHEDRAADEGVE